MSATPNDLLLMLKWLVSFHDPAHLRAVIDSEPLKQAKRLIERYEATNAQPEQKEPTVSQLLTITQIDSKGPSVPASASSKSPAPETAGLYPHGQETV